MSSRTTPRGDRITGTARQIGKSRATGVAVVDGYVKYSSNRIGVALEIRLHLQSVLLHFLLHPVPLLRGQVGENHPRVGVEAVDLEPEAHVSTRDTEESSSEDAAQAAYEANH